jgi:uncharacterized protein involved in exopolysaccharide biosynthesis
MTVQDTRREVQSARNALATQEWYQFTRAVINEIRGHWRSLVVLSLVGGAIGFGVATLLPSNYKSGAAFQAEAQTGSPLSGSVAAIASQLGASPLAGASNAQFFGDLLTMDAVLRRVGKATFPWDGSSQSLATIYGASRLPSGKREFAVVQRLRKALSVDVNVRTGVVRFTVEARTPELAEAIAESTLAALNEANIILRQGRAAAEQTFTADRAEQARLELTRAESTLTAFYQRNRALGNSPGLQLEEARRRRAVELAQQLYLQLRLQEEQAAVQAVRNTPAISVIDPPLVPTRRSWPNRRLATFVGVLLGALLSFVMVLQRPDS